ncbi:MAG: dihydropteroate synthase-like protein [Promethearchaeota archaeon]
MIITGQNSYSTIKKIIQPIREHTFTVIRAQISVSAFLTEMMTHNILKNQDLTQYNLVLLPGFVQWDTSKLEKNFLIEIKKGPEFASDLPSILKNLDKIELSNKIPANKLIEISGEKLYNQILKEKMAKAKENFGTHTFYLNETTSNLIIGRDLPPPIIAEIVNCTKKSDKSIIKKVEHYINSGADVIDIGCIANKPNPNRVEEIINLIRNNFDILISIDSMDTNEILTAVESKIDLILSLDLGNYIEFSDIPKDIAIVILPTNVNEGYFPKDPKTRVNNLFKLTRRMLNFGFKKLIADPLLETPITPGICNSLETYFLYKKEISKPENTDIELPMFFGISNVVELMDIDSVGINGLLASIAIELDMGILFTVEHSTKLMGGVAELKESTKLCYLSKYNKSPPINQGIQIFKAKGKTSQVVPKFNKIGAIIVERFDDSYIQDKKGYFKIFIDRYSRKISVLFFSNEHKLSKTLIGTNAEALSKRIMEENLTNDLSHMNYLGRELKKAEICLKLGKPYIQDE